MGGSRLGIRDNFPSDPGGLGQIPLAESGGVQDVGQKPPISGSQDTQSSGDIGGNPFYSAVKELSTKRGDAEDGEKSDPVSGPILVATNDTLPPGNTGARPLPARVVTETVQSFQDIARGFTGSSDVGRRYEISKKLKPPLGDCDITC